VINELLADAAHVWDLGILAYPDPVIDDTAQMLHKVAIDIGRDLADRLIEEDFNSGISTLRSGWGLPLESKCRRSACGNQSGGTR